MERCYRFDRDDDPLSEPVTMFATIGNVGRYFSGFFLFLFLPPPFFILGIERIDDDVDGD